MTFGEKLYQLRTERGMSQETLARHRLRQVYGIPMPPKRKKK